MVGGGDLLLGFDGVCLGNRNEWLFIIKVIYGYQAAASLFDCMPGKGTHFFAKERGWLMERWSADVHVCCLFRAQVQKAEIEENDSQIKLNWRNDDKCRRDIVEANCSTAGKQKRFRFNYWTNMMLFFAILYCIYVRMIFIAIARHHSCDVYCKVVRCARCFWDWWAVRSAWVHFLVFNNKIK